MIFRSKILGLRCFLQYALYRQRNNEYTIAFAANKEESTKAMSKRDWALGERERTLSERDSIRTMCDQLRRERDDAISSLAKAIKDSDDLQRQREKAERELKQLRDRADVDAHGNERATSPSNSRDSAIDTDLAEWDVETLELSMVRHHSSSSCHRCFGVILIPPPNSVQSGRSFFNPSLAEGEKNMVFWRENSNFCTEI